jgi:dolichol-phosphate mannosyltransferase
MELERERYLTCPIRARRYEVVPKAMSNVDYNNGNIVHAADKAVFLLTRLSKFLVVGGIGVLVNNLALFVLFQWMHLSLVVASIPATELAIINNFYCNDRWTFKQTHISLSRFARFNLVSLSGLLITTGTLWVLASHMGLYYLVANLLGIGLATVWNFVVNSLWTWGGAG